MKIIIENRLVTQENSSPLVYVIIPNKNGIAHLSYSLPVLGKSTYSNYEVILIDDHSVDNSVIFVEDSYPHIKVKINERKQGYAGSVNTGISYALEQGADYVAIFNSDIKVIPNWMERAIDVFHAEPNAGLVGYTEILKENESLFYRVKELNDKVEYKFVKGLPGCLYLCPAAVLRCIGLYDEEYYMYGEDNDYFSRLTKASYAIVQMNVPVWHFGEGSSENRKFLSSWLAYRNALRYAIKNESLKGIIRILLSLLNQGCNLFLRLKPNDPNFKRLRRHNVFVNFVLLIASCCWNLFYLPKTLKLRILTPKIQH